MNLNFTMVVQAIVFALFIWFTVKYAWPLFLSKVDARTKTIADGLAEAERGKASLADAQKQMKKYPDGRQASAVVPLLGRAQEQNGGHVTEPMMRVIGERSFTFRNTPTRVEKAILGNEAGLYGAAYLPFQG